MGRTNERRTTNYREETETGGPRLDATEKSAAGAVAVLKAGSVHETDNGAATSDATMDGNSSCPWAKEQTAHGR